MARRNRLRNAPRRSSKFLKYFFVTLVAATVATAAMAAYVLFEREAPELVLEKDLHYLGGTVELPLQVTDRKSGVRSITITLSQNDTTAELLKKTFPRQAWLTTAGPNTVSEKVAIDARAAGFAEGEAELLFSVRDFSLNNLMRGNHTKKRIAVIIDTTPPRVSIHHAQRYIRPGGSGIAIYTVSEPPARHGVMIDSTVFPGAPLPGKDQYIAYFALPWDAEAPRSTVVFATDAAGNEGTAPFATNFRTVAEKRDTLTISDQFLQRKLPEFHEHYPEMSGTLLEQFLFLNNQVRVENDNFIAQICQTSEPNRLWSDRFLRMPGAKRGGFPDQRTYVYNGEVVDVQTHLGVDIASTQHASIRAANRGKVVFTDYLGIYGNTVILDHGQGVFSLYSHLSSYETTLGSLVEKDEPIGRTGVSGMAGGDHLHFSMLVHGIFVSPLEWWDQNWIDINIQNILNEL
ncbi:M23 family metallopeptidase [Desulfobulbus alkaliphilus]|uniref:M23 family metallopeptidase n=1 Tax=Desulfobulbus alkaliphilus TaxID=869814 RepID=UPI001962EC87|nr:M23 family metallopeptidase [Desulfobulbus alkaliphilus]MBM9538232.1 M23 family metallopeptidase [Desulfobulbus alkaliphilus]